MAKKLQAVDFSDSYISIILGFLVVLVGGILLYNFFTKTKPSEPTKENSVAQAPTLTQTPPITSTTPVSTKATSPTTVPSQIPTKAPAVTPFKAPTLTSVPTQGPKPVTYPSKLPTKYTVVANDTLWSIAEKFYSSGYNWVDIAKENKIANPKLIASGTELTIPNAKVIQPENIASVGSTSKGDILPSAVSTPKTYTIQHGDTLWGIAVKVYADGFAWPKIAQANHLTHPNLIHAGNTLQIP